MTREEAIDIIKCLAWHTRPNEEDIEQAIKTLEQELIEKKHSKTCGTCRHFRKERDKRNIEISKKIFGENTICGHCTYWEDTREVALPTTEYDYCSRYSEVDNGNDD